MSQLDYINYPEMSLWRSQGSIKTQLAGDLPEVMPQAASGAGSVPQPISSATAGCGPSLTSR